MPSKEQVKRYKEKFGEEVYKKMVADAVKKWKRENPDKAKETRAKWDKKNRARYQREYRLRKKSGSHDT